MKHEPLGFQTDTLPPPLASSRKKLIEVALPLDAINAASAREKSIRHGHPSTLHLWWARRSLGLTAVRISAGLPGPKESSGYRRRTALEQRAVELSERRDKKKRPLRGVGPKMLSPAGYIK